MAKPKPNTERRPPAGGRWIRTPDGRLVDEPTWRAERQAERQAGRQAGKEAGK